MSQFGKGDPTFRHAGGGAPRRFLGTHWIFLGLVASGVFLRVWAMLGYRGAMWFPDSFAYLSAAMEPRPHLARPVGYSFLLWLLQPFHSFTVIVAVQHLMGIAIAVLLYTLLRRRFGLPAWGAALAAAPVLLDAYQIQLEHLVMADTLFTLLLVGAVTVVLWRLSPGPLLTGATGLLLGLATITRSVGLPLIALLGLYLLVSRVGWRALGTAAVACALPLVLYATWFDSTHGRFALTNSSGVFLYGRTMSFADCGKFEVPQGAQALCATGPPDDRQAAQWYVWSGDAPIHRLRGSPFQPERSQQAGEFARRAILAQPGDYLRVVGSEITYAFRWGRPVFPDQHTYEKYEFKEQEVPLIDRTRARVDPLRYGAGPAETRVVEPYAGNVRFYQKNFYLRGVFLGLILLLGLGGLVRVWRHFGGPALLPWSFGAAMIVLPSTTALFDYRYIPPIVPLACLAAAIAFSRRPVKATGPAAGAEHEVADEDPRAQVAAGTT